MGINRIIFYILIFVVCGVFGVITLNISDTTHDSPKLLLLFSGTSIACIFWAVKGFKAGVFSKTKGLNLAIGIYLSSCILSAIFGINWVVSLFGAYKQCGGVLILIVYLAFFYLSANFITRQNIKILFRFLIFTGTCCCIYGVGQKIGICRFASLPMYGRVYSTFGQPVYFGCFIAMMIPIILYEMNRTMKIWLLPVLILFVFCLFIAQARSGLIATVLISIPLLYMYGNNKLLMISVLSAFIVILIVGIFISANTHGIVNLYSRFTHNYDYAPRLELYAGGWAAIKHSPLFGIGQDNVRPHNILIGHCAKLGIVGFLAFIYLGYSSIRSFMFSEYQDLKLFYTLFAVCCAYLIFRQFNPGYIPVTIFFSMITGSIYGVKNNCN